MEQFAPAKIVVIDDHPEHLDYLATLLRRAGYEVAAFTAGMSALNSTEIHAANLVVTNVFMPEMDGFEVLKVLQKAHPALPVVAVSGASGSLTATMLTGIERLGARACFSKPLDEDTLLHRVAALVGKSGKRSA